jgi:hypothetical protein
MNGERKAIAILLLLIFFFALTLAVATASKKLEVQKLLDNGNNKEIKVGDEVTILLKFKNPFNREIPVRIVDRNVFGNNGLEIKCLEYTLPAKDESVFTYRDRIVPFKPGKYSLDAAKITYTNPETGKCETVESNTLDLEVKANDTLLPGQQQHVQGITTIYQCNGTNIRSTSYSSYGSSFNIQIGSSSHSNEQQQSGGQHQESIEKRVTNNQISQNTGQLKKELEKEIQEQNPWWLLLLIPIAGVIATGWFILGKYLKKPKTPSFAIEQVVPPDYVREARRMVEEAEQLFKDNGEKDAYERISQALRFYFSYKQGIKQELLKSELMDALRGKVDADMYSKVQECLDWCEKVEFAKYKPNEKDFEKIIGVTKEIILTNSR